MPVCVRIPSLLDLAARWEPPRAASSLPPCACVPWCPCASWQRGLGVCPPASIAALSVCPPWLPAAHPPSLPGTVPSRELPVWPPQTRLLQGTTRAAVPARWQREGGVGSTGHRAHPAASSTHESTTRPAPHRAGTGPCAAAGAAGAGGDRVAAGPGRYPWHRRWGWDMGSVGPAAVLGGDMCQHQLPAPARAPLGAGRLVGWSGRHAAGGGTTAGIPAPGPARSLRRGLAQPRHSVRWGLAQPRHSIRWERVPGKPFAVSPSARRPSPLRRCLSFPRLPAGGKAVNTAPAPGQPPLDESDRKTEPHSSVSDLVNSLTSEMLMVGAWGSAGTASHPGHCLGVSSHSPGSSRTLLVPQTLWHVPACSAKSSAQPGTAAGAAVAQPRRRFRSLRAGVRELCRRREGRAVRRDLANWHSLSPGRVARSQESSEAMGGGRAPGRA